MSSRPPILSPGGFVPQQAIAYADGASAIAVGGATPLPVTARTLAADVAPLSGMMTSSGVAGPFVPQLGRPIWLTLGGTWTGSATVQRSSDGGATWLPLTVGGQPWGSFTANANEPVAEDRDAAATYRLVVTIATGALSYRVSQ